MSHIILSEKENNKRKHLRSNDCWCLSKTTTGNLSPKHEIPIFLFSSALLPFSLLLLRPFMFSNNMLGNKLIKSVVNTLRGHAVPTSFIVSRLRISCAVIWSVTSCWTYLRQEKKVLDRKFFSVYYQRAKNIIAWFAQWKKRKVKWIWNIL